MKRIKIDSQQQQQPQSDINLEKVANDRDNCINNIEGNHEGLKVKKSRKHRMAKKKEKRNEKITE